MLLLMVIPITDKTLISIDIQLTTLLGRIPPPAQPRLARLIPPTRCHMSGTPSIPFANKPLACFLIVCCSIFALALPAVAQDQEINRYTLYTGFDWMNNPGLNLTQRGFDIDFGVTVKPWMAIGGDFSAAGDAVFSGSGTINGADTVYAPKIDGAPFPGVPPASAIHVPLNSTSYTFAVGPQFYLRKWRKVTFFARPGLGGIHANADVKFPPGLGGLLGALGVTPPNPHQTDTQLFFGAGGGFDINLSKRVALRFTADWINTHLFSDILTNRQNYVRCTVGPTFRWGRLP